MFGCATDVDLVRLLLTDAGARLTYFDQLETPGNRLPAMLSDERITALVERGELTDEEAGALLVHPFEMQIIAELIDASLPDVWLDRIARAGKSPFPCGYCGRCEVCCYGQA